MLVFGQFLPEFCNPRWCRVEPNMIGMGSEMHQIAIQIKGWHLVAYLFRGTWGQFGDQFSKFSQLFLDILRETRNVLID